jgi:4-hydroxy-2-oxoglutarate aldolase
MRSGVSRGGRQWGTVRDPPSRLARRTSVEYIVGNMALLEGIFPPIPTPFDADDEIDVVALAENLSWWNRFDLSGVVVLGSNGEAVLLDASEKLRLIEAVRAGVAEDRTMIVGTGAQSTRATISLTRAAGRAGADYALVLPPFYYKGMMTADVLERHFRAVADASPIPVVLYNMPACTGIDLGAELVVRLAAHENIAGLKDSSGDVVKLGQIHGELGGRFRLLAGSASFLLPAWSVGAVGGVLALANIAPRQCIEILGLASAGDVQTAAELQVRMIPPNSAVTRRWGVPGLKAAMEMLGLRGGPVRAPLAPIGHEKRDELRGILIKARILDSGA